LLELQDIGDENEFFEALCEGLALPQTLRGWQLGRALRQRGQRYVVCLDEIEKMVDPHGCITVELMRRRVLQTNAQQH
jgi:hypothetical protein